MTERSYQDAVQTLVKRLGGRWEGLETAGRDQIAKILRDELGYDHSAAEDTIEAMLASGQLRYHRLADQEHAVVPPPLAPPGEGMATGLPAAGGLGGMSLAPGALANMGYWQIGRDESDAPGRAGQVRAD